MPSGPSRVLAHLRWRFQYGQDVIAGLVAAMGGRRVEVITASGESALDAAQVAALRPRVIIGDSHYAATREAAAGLGVPFVDVTGGASGPGMHHVLVDDATVGRLAADFLLGKGFASLAFVGFSDMAYSTRRERAFAAALGGRGCPAYRTPLAPEMVGARDRRLVAFLEALPRPCGVFACSDLRAVDVLTAATHAGLRLPEDLGLVGVDVDLTLRGLVGRRLTSIDQSAWFVGWQAGQLAMRLLRDPAIPPTATLLPALRVVEGDTTGMALAGDPMVDALVAAIARNVGRPDGLARSLGEVPLSRRALEVRCRAALGRSPLQVLHRHRLDLATRLLSDPALAVAEVAARVGFEHPGDFTRFVRRHLALSPRELRTRLTRTAD